MDHFLDCGNTPALRHLRVGDGGTEGGCKVQPRWTSSRFAYLYLHIRTFYLPMALPNYQNSQFDKRKILDFFSIFDDRLSKLERRMAELETQQAQSSSSQAIRKEQTSTSEPKYSRSSKASDTMPRRSSRTVTFEPVREPFCEEVPQDKIKRQDQPDIKNIKYSIAQLRGIQRDAKSAIVKKSARKENVDVTSSSTTSSGEKMKLASPKDQISQGLSLKPSRPATVLKLFGSSIIEIESDGCDDIETSKIV